MHPLEQLRDDALREIEAARDDRSLEAVRVKYLGKSGTISEWGERMKTLGKEERPVVGKLLNQVRNAVTAAFDQREEKLRAEKESDTLANIDISLPGMIFGATVRSAIPCGRIVNIEYGLGIPWQEFTIVSAADIPGENTIVHLTKDHPCLAVTHVNHALSARG